MSTFADFRLEAEAWEVCATAPIAQAEAVHLWRVDLDLPTATLSGLAQCLSSDEQRRASGYRFARDRERFIAARGALRSVLARYLGVTPERVRFSYHAHGKPGLANTSAIRFSLSHAHRLALIAVTLDREVGVDVEWIRPELATLQVAEQFFSPYEVGVLRALSGAERVMAFFQCWTRKEAYVKARGEGLTLPLDQFDVTLTPGEPAALLRPQPSSPAGPRWAMVSCVPATGYVAAVVVKGDPMRVEAWRWLDTALKVRS